MKKIVNKLIFSLFLAFISITSVNAGVCGNITVNKNNPYIQCEDWSSKVKVCDMASATVTHVVDCCRFNSSADAQNSCIRTESVRGYKSMTTISFPACDKSMVIKRYTCTTKKACTTSTCGELGCHCLIHYEYDKDKDSPTYNTLISSYPYYASGTYSSSDYVGEIGASLGATIASCKGAGNVECNCKPYYGLEYDVYTCNRAIPYDTNGTCEASYNIGGVPAYCINPDNFYPDKTSMVNVDVTQCESSNSTKECGYGNILIESYYRKNIKGNQNYSYGVTVTAMQLWGAHVGAAGYWGVGIAPQDYNGDIYFMPDPDYENIFKNTVKYLNYYLMEEIANQKINSIYDINTDADSSIEQSGLKQVTCNLAKVGMVCSGSGKKYLHAILLYINTLQGNPKMMDHLNEINGVKSTEIGTDNTPVDASTTVVDEKVQITYKLKNNVEIDCDTNKNMNKEACKTTQTVKIHSASGDEISEVFAYDYCKKNFCYKTITPKSTIVCSLLEKTKVTIEVLTKTICGANSVKQYVSCGNTSEDQIMFTFEKDNNCKTEESTTEKKVIEEELLCENCRDSATVEKGDCKSSGNDSTINSKAADPSLNCILHKSSYSDNVTNSRDYYDYSNYFKVNTNVCRIYCSDEVEYYLPGKKTVLLGLQLKYDIENQAYKETKKDNSLTSFIKLKRNCVSKIYYDKLPFDYDKNWVKAYDLDKKYSQDGNKITNWSKLYEAISEKSMSQNNRTEILNELIYDLYNCNLYSDSEIKAKTNNLVSKPKNSVNSYKTAQNNLNSETNNIISNSTSNIKYEGGASYITDAATGTSNTVGSKGSDPVLSNTNSIGAYDIDVKYCTEDKCFTGPRAGEYPEDYDSATSTSLTSSVKFGTDNVTIPANDYAIFTLETEVDFYNSSIYQTQPYTGKVQLYNENDKDKYTSLEKNTYPISLSAKSTCKNGICSVNHNFNITLFSRKNDTDLLTAAVSKANEYSCQYTVDSDKNLDDGKTSYGFVYKNIDLEDPFPSSRAQSGSNWDTPYAKTVIEDIIKSGNSNLYASDEYLEYSFVLDEESINSIRNFNKTHDYTNNSLTDCELSGDKYVNCKSTFLTDFYANTYGGEGQKIEKQESGGAN